MLTFYKNALKHHKQPLHVLLAASQAAGLSDADYITLCEIAGRL